MQEKAGVSAAAVSPCYVIILRFMLALIYITKIALSQMGKKIESMEDS
jgi:hypothetical protein